MALNDSIARSEHLNCVNQYTEKNGHKLGHQSSGFPLDSGNIFSFPVFQQLEHCVLFLTVHNKFVFLGALLCS